MTKAYAVNKRSDERYSVAAAMVTNDSLRSCVSVERNCRHSQQQSEGHNVADAGLQQTRTDVDID